MLFASVGIFGVFLFLTYYLQGTLGFSPIKSGIAFLPLIAVLIAVAQVSNRILLPRFGPKPMVPFGLLVSATALFGLREVGLHSAYVSHVLPFLIVLGIGSGLSVSPSFSTGTLGLAPKDAGVGSAALNTAQQVGGSIGTALLNTLAASAATSYLVGRAHSAVTAQEAVTHGDSTAFLWSAFAFIAGAIVASLVLERGSLAVLMAQPEVTVERGSASSAQTEIVQVPIACRAC
jgi:sugar phosphate permease